jgi:hypothetical protein
MPLSTDSLATLARKNAAIGPVLTAINVASGTNADPNDGDGVDVSEAIWCEVTIRPTGGDVNFDILGESIGDTVFDGVNEGIGLTATASKGFKELVRVATLGELYVKLNGGGATAVYVGIAPCLG